jgi:probable F420-dependent oxidoreductase
VKLGLYGINIGLAATSPGLLPAIASRAEAAGWESVWTAEHFVLPDPPVAVSPAPPGTPMLDPFVALATAAARTERLLIGTDVTVVPLYRPLMLAKQVASLDRLSDGRFLFGVGVGYLEPEFRALGVGLPDRGSKLEEHLDAMHAIWDSSGPASFAGEHVVFDGVRAVPAPVRRSGPPLHVGGYAPASFRRAVERGHGWLGYDLGIDDAARCIDQLVDAAARCTRGPDLPPLEISVTPDRATSVDPGAVVAYAELGVDRLIVLPPPERLRDEAALLAFVDELPAQVGMSRAGI